MSATRKAFCNNIWCDDAADLPAAGQFIGQICFVMDSPVVIKRWDGASWVTVTPDFPSSGSGGRYDPQREPAEIDPSCSDNFIGGSQLTWRWGNQGTSTDTDEMDEATLVPQAAAGNNRRCRWITCPNAVDFCVTLFYSAEVIQDHNQQGIILLETGSEATPTKLWIAGAYSSTGARVGFWSATSYTSANTDIGNEQINTIGIGAKSQPFWYIQLRYTASSKELGAFWSTNGFGWRQLSVNQVLGSHPLSIGRYANPDNGTEVGTNRAYWFRTFTNGVAGATSAQYAGGQVGS